MSTILRPKHSSTPKRRVFFSFHYNDIWRVNQVRSSHGFFDASIWEKSKRTNPESLKNLIRNKIKNSSVTCILVGSETFGRRWVRYEIARSVIKGNGILSVLINEMSDQLGRTSVKGPNPLDFVGFYNEDGDIFLMEDDGEKWRRYRDYTIPLKLPIRFNIPHRKIIRVSDCYRGIYCFKRENGRKNFPRWIQKAATDVGR